MRIYLSIMFFLNDEVSGIIDFYFACTDQLVYDIAITLNAWCFEADVNFNITKAKAILEGYQTVRPLSEAEIQALPILSRGAALRFLLTRLHDWFNHDPEALVRPKKSDRLFAPFTVSQNRHPPARLRHHPRKDLRNRSS